jgi:uncharacterized damage-inducible protein DinB
MSTAPSPRVVSCDPAPGYSPGIGRYITQLTLVRQELLGQLEGLSPAKLSWHPNETVESIGTQLLHVAAIEWSWVFEDISGRPAEEYTGWEEALPIRFGLPQAVGRPLEAYLEKLNQVREETFAALRGLTDDDLPKLRPEQPAEPGGEQYTIDWILFHLVEHEAHHAGQVELMVRLLPAGL